MNKRTLVVRTRGKRVVFRHGLRTQDVEVVVRRSGQRIEVDDRVLGADAVEVSVADQFEIGDRVTVFG